jgi:hypothetical protein
MILHLFAAVLAGYFAHYTYLLTSRLSNGWSQLSAYTLGVLFALPFVRMVHDDLAEVGNPAKRLTAAYLLAYLAFGVGTTIGWVLHPVDGPVVSMMDDTGIR